MRKAASVRSDAQADAVDASIRIESKNMVIWLGLGNRKGWREGSQREVIGQQLHRNASKYLSFVL